MAQPTKSKNKSNPHDTPTPGLHYNKQSVHEDYAATFRMFMVALAIGVLGAVIYFFGMVIFLGGWGHTKTDDYIREFGTRIQYDYKGTRLPEYDNPALLNQPATPNKAH